MHPPLGPVVSLGQVCRPSRVTWTISDCASGEMCLPLGQSVSVTWTSIYRVLDNAQQDYNSKTNILQSPEGWPYRGTQPSHFLYNSMCSPYLNLSVDSRTRSSQQDTVLTDSFRAVARVRATCRNSGSSLVVLTSTTVEIATSTKC